MRTGRAFLVVAITALGLGVALGLGWRGLPRHDGWWAAGLLLVLGIVFGLRALVLPFLVCVPWGLLIYATSKCVYECSAWIVFLTIIPALLCVPALAGAAVRAAVRFSRHRPLSGSS